MTMTYLTLNPTVGDINSLIVPAESPDLKSELQNKWTLWIQTDVDQSDASNYKNATKPVVSFDSMEV